MLRIGMTTRCHSEPIAIACTPRLEQARHQATIAANAGSAPDGTGCPRALIDRFETSDRTLSRIAEKPPRIDALRRSDGRTEPARFCDWKPATRITVSILPPSAGTARRYTASLTRADAGSDLRCCTTWVNSCASRRRPCALSGL